MNPSGEMSDEQTPFISVMEGLVDGQETTNGAVNR
jgi:hypothetical protein